MTIVLPKKTVHLFQPQYPAKFGDTINYWLPYSIGCLWAYLTQYPEIMESYCLGGLHHARRNINRLVEELDSPAVCAFSCYVWNEQYCLALAQAVKKRWPNCYIIFGGPQTGGNHIIHDFIDTIVMAEGEQSLLGILTDLKTGRTPDKFYSKQRIDNLDMPSPYLLGLFDNLVDNVDANVWFQAMLETNRGCPFACTFCDWGTTTYSKVKKFQLEKIEKEIQWFADHKVNAVYLCDANFGAFKSRDMEITKMLRHYLDGSNVDYINITWAKNSNQNVFSIAKELGSICKGVTLAAQSMNPATLKAIKRDNLKVNDFAELLKLSENYQVPTYTEMILGLPEETVESWKQGLCELIELGQHNFVEIYFASILENAELNKQRLQYKIKTVRGSNYMPGSFDDVESEIEESNQIVYETSTMSRTDMCEAYMYGWMIQNFHYAGYSQILAKYCRYVKQIAYRDFYDTIFAHLSKDIGPIGTYFAKHKALYLEIMKQRDSQERAVDIHSFMGKGEHDLYDLKTVMNQYVLSVCQTIADIDPTVLNLQSNFVIDRHRDTRQIHRCNYDPRSWTPEVVYYQLKPKSGDLKYTAETMVRYRRRGWQKYRIEIIEPNHIV